jgi:cysteinyl-tRNA synthetase, unknown class
MRFLSLLLLLTLPLSALADPPLSSVRYWMYQLQGLDEDGAVEALAASAYDMLVLEPGNNFSEWPYDTASMVRALAITPDGRDRILLAYIDVGQAEDYRDYWAANWRAPTLGRPGSPDFIVTADPDGWSGNYPVAYWDPAWQELWLGPQGIVADLARFGFDGIYLDWVEAYDDDIIRARATEQAISPELAMIDFIERLGAAGREIDPGFLVVPQNAQYLIDAAPIRYAHAIDALAVEDTWFHGLGDSDWDDPDGGDQHDRHDGDYTTAARLAQVTRYRQAGLPVFSVDYAFRPDNVAMVYDQARRNGLVPLVSRVALSRITGTPPPGLPD